jgi:1-phosphatidylinositol-4-phosphate 5-kinase
MHSVFPPEASAFITERFDLKGSTVGRECSQEERRSKGANAVLKDLDLKREVEDELKTANEGDRNRKRTISRHGICIGWKHKLALMAQLERDVDLLCRCNVLDYSLLVGVVDMETTKGGRRIKESSRACIPRCIQSLFRWMDFPMPYYGAEMTPVDGGALSSLRGTRKGKQVIYYLGVIDFLQPWTVKKRLERDLKGLAGYDKSAISCVAPTDYADRFLKFFDAHVT